MLELQELKGKLAEHTIYRSPGRNTARYEVNSPQRDIPRLFHHKKDSYPSITRNAILKLLFISRDYI